jgi:hypothetical protein
MIFQRRDRSRDGYLPIIPRYDLCPLLPWRRLAVLGNVVRSFNAAEIFSRHRCCSFHFAFHDAICCAGERKTARGSSLARLWLFAWLSLARTHRMGVGAKSRSRILVWRPSLLPRALERRWFWSMLDADANWANLELRSLIALQSPIPSSTCCIWNEKPRPMLSQGPEALAVTSRSGPNQLSFN